MGCPLPQIKFSFLFIESAAHDRVPYYGADADGFACSVLADAEGLQEWHDAHSPSIKLPAPVQLGSYGRGPAHFSIHFLHQTTDSFPDMPTYSESLRCQSRNRRATPDDNSIVTPLKSRLRMGFPALGDARKASLANSDGALRYTNSSASASSTS